MLGKEEAEADIRAYLWGWRPGDYNDAWVSPEEAERMNRWMLQWYEAEMPIVILKCEEVPCGWLCEIATRYKEYSCYLVNGWTGDVVPLSASHLGVPTIEAALREYIDNLPEEQRSMAQERRGKLPFAPVRFYPPRVIVHMDGNGQPEPTLFSVELDIQTFHKIGLPPPALRATEIRRNDEYAREMVSLHNGLHKIREQNEAGKCLAEYELTLPPTTNTRPRDGSRVSTLIDLDIHWWNGCEAQEIQKTYFMWAEEARERRSW